MAAPHSISQSPFASYDLVVYFGGGFFSLIVLANALPWSTNIAAPLALFAQYETVVKTAVQIVFLGFGTYIFGHIIAYLSDQFVEKAFVSIIGYPIKWIGELSSNGRRDNVRRMVANNLRAELTLAFILRTLFHAPLIPFYFIAFYRFGMDGFYRSRLPYDTLSRIDKRFVVNKMETETGQEGWFRMAEQYVINNQTVATARMYNYVVIYGILRILTFTMICVVWLHIISTIIDSFYYSFQLDNKGFYRFLLLFIRSVATYFVYSSTAILLIFSFGKYYRRYSEEALFAFILTKPAPLEA